MRGGGAFAEQRTWTLDADFDEGTIVNLNHDPKHDQIQLYDGDTKPFRFINVAASGRGTVVRIDTDTGEVVGEYKTAPEGRGLSPSRTSVDLRGNVWTANRGEAGDDKGSAVKIGIVVGGTRCNKDGSLNPNGDYVKLEPDKLIYNTCVDRNKDGLIRTSKGLLDILPWQDNGDGQGGAGGGDAQVQDAEDECVLIYQRLPDAHNTRHISVDRENNVWAAGYSSDDCSIKWTATRVPSLNLLVRGILAAADTAALSSTTISTRFLAMIFSGRPVLLRASCCVTIFPQEQANV